MCQHISGVALAYVYSHIQHTGDGYTLLYMQHCIFLFITDSEYYDSTVLSSYV